MIWFYAFFVMKYNLINVDVSKHTQMQIHSGWTCRLAVMQTFKGIWIMQIFVSIQGNWNFFSTNDLNRENKKFQYSEESGTQISSVLKFLDNEWFLLSRFHLKFILTDQLLRGERTPLKNSRYSDYPNSGIPQIKRLDTKPFCASQSRRLCNGAWRLLVSH